MSRGHLVFENGGSMDRLRVTTITPAQCQAARKKNAGSKKKPNGVYDPDQHDDHSTQRKIERMPLVTLTDKWLATVPESDESLAALAELMAVARAN